LVAFKIFGIREAARCHNFATARSGFLADSLLRKAIDLITEFRWEVGKTGIGARSYLLRTEFVPV
jgi:hypothetical protein